MDIVLKALSKPSYEPLGEASMKHLTLKTVFLLAVSSAGRCNELQALFDPKYIQFKPKGAGAKFMQVNNPWYIPGVSTGKSDFGAPNCLVRALRYCSRYITDHPELRNASCRLFVLIKDNAALWKSKNSSKDLRSGYFVATLKQGRPTCSDDGQKMVQQRHLHILLPLPAS